FLPRIQGVCVLVCRVISWINTIIRFVTFECGGHSGNFGLGAGPSTFPLHITRRGQNQTSQDDDDGDDDQKLDESEGACSGRRFACDCTYCAADMAASTGTDTQCRRNDGMTKVKKVAPAGVRHSD